MKKIKPKKVIIALIVIILLAIVGVLIYNYVINKDYVENFSLCTIQTYNGEEINDYKTNKMSFVIADYSSEASIKVNGEDYKDNLGFYKPGKYEIEVTLGEKTEKSIININSIDEEEQNEYNIFITAETLPTLFASFDMIKEKDVPAFVWYQRSDTLNIDELKNMFSNVTISEYVGQGALYEIKNKVVPEIKEYVSNVLKNDENAHFNVYVTAEYYWLEIATLEELGLTDERVDIVMYSCGTVDYVVDYGFTGENTYEFFKYEKANFEEAIDYARANLCKDDTELVFLQNVELGSINKDYVLINALRNNVTYYLQFPDLISFKDEEVANDMKEANIQKIVAREQFNSLTQEQKEEFFRCVNLDKEEFDTNYFNSEEGKYLIITGTNPYYGKYSKQEFQNMMEQVIEKYGEEYELLYKPHPMAMPIGEDEEYLNEQGIKILPARMPMEAILFVYDGLKLGGFDSSLYMSLDEGNTLFFFNDSVENLVSPLNVLYDDLFSEAEFIQPQESE